MNVKKLLQDKIKKQNTLDNENKSESILSAVSYDDRLDNFLDNLNKLFIEGIIDHDINVNGNIQSRSIKTGQLIVRGGVSIGDDNVRVIKTSDNILKVRISTDFDTSDLRDKVPYKRITGTIDTNFIGKLNIAKILKKKILSKNRIDKINHFLSPMTSKFIKDNFNWSYLKDDQIIVKDNFDKSTKLNKTLFPPVISTDNIIGKKNINTLPEIKNNMLNNNYHYYNDISLNVNYDNLIGNLPSNIINNFDICFNSLVKDAGWDQNNEMSSDELLNIFGDTSFGMFLKGSIADFDNTLFSDKSLKNFQINENINKMCFDIINNIDLHRFKLKFTDNEKIGVIADEIKDCYNLTSKHSYSLKTDIDVSINNFMIEVFNKDLLSVKDNIEEIDLTCLNEVIIFKSNKDISNIYYDLVHENINYNIKNNYTFTGKIQYLKNNTFRFITNDEKILNINENYKLDKFGIVKGLSFKITRITLKEINHVLFTNLFYLSLGALQEYKRIMNDDINYNNNMIKILEQEILEQENKYEHQLKDIERLEKLI